MEFSVGRAVFHRLSTSAEATISENVYVSNAMNQRLSEAIDKFGTVDVTVRDQTKKLIDFPLHLCGKPLDNKEENDGVPVMGKSVSAEGRKQPTMPFLYLSRTSHDAKQRSNVEVELGKNGNYRVGELGFVPLRPPKRPVRRDRT